MDTKRLKEVFAPGDGDGDGDGDVHRHRHGDVWYLILNHCDLRDCIRMGAVCKTWLSFSKWSIRSRGPQLPWLMMLYNHSLDSLEKDEDEGVRCLFSLSDKAMFGIKFSEMCGKRCCGSFTNGWLLMIDDENLDIRLFHPWQRIQLQLPDFPISIPPPITYKQSLLHSVKIIKASISDDREVVVVILYNGNLAFCRVIDGEKLWTLVRSGQGYLDLIYHKGQFYAMSFMGGIGVLHINTPNQWVETVMEDDVIAVGLYNRTYMLGDSTSDSLFIFVRRSLSSQHPLDPIRMLKGSGSTMGFKVYELRLKDESGDSKENPVEVKSLDDRVIFLGQNSSMLVTASQFPGLKGNRIYFTEDNTNLFFTQLPIKCRDLGIFNMEDKTVQPLFEDGFHPTFWPPIWIAPPL